MDTTTDRSALEGKLIPELQQIAQRLGIEGSQKLRKSGLIDAIVERSSGDGASSNGPAAATGRYSTPSDDGGSNGHRSAVDVDRPDETQRDGGNDRPQGDSDQGERQPGDRQPSDRQPTIVSRAIVRGTDSATIGPKATARAEIARKVIVRRAAGRKGTVPRESSPWRWPSGRPSSW